ncbi:MAG: hypothetical protein HOV82_14070 [Streptomyces sp.]|nr:hypothetical protein [Streptomyces sp.]NUS24559.1 hypothetical protein [Streptomyces sp.]
MQTADIPGYVFGLDRPGEGQSLMPAIPNASAAASARLAIHADAPITER